MKFKQCTRELLFTVVPSQPRSNATKKSFSIRFSLPEVSCFLANNVSFSSKPFLTTLVFFLPKGIRVFDETVPEGAVQLGPCPSGETDCRNITFVSSDISRDGPTHAVTVKSVLGAFSTWNEDIRRGDMVGVEVNAASPAGLVDTELLMSLVVSAANDSQMYENQPVRIMRDGTWRLYHIVWEGANWRRVYKACQADGTPGVCLVDSVCSGAGKSPRAASATVTGCQKITKANVKCCPGYADPPSAMFALPVNSSVPNQYVGLRFQSLDKTGVSQTVMVRSASLCNDACGGVCNITGGFVCNVPTKSCQCMNKYPFVLGPDNKCYSTSPWAAPPAWPCQACPRNTMYTFYNDSAAAKLVLPGTDRLKCFFNTSTVDPPAPGESCCKYKCRCESGFEPASSGLPLSPGLKNCVPSTAPAPDATAPLPDDCKNCGDDQTCLFGQCTCDERRGWTLDETKPQTATEVYCVHKCGNCAQPERCAQPASKKDDVCKCLPMYTRVTDRNGTGPLTCQIECASKCGANEECSYEEGQCICASGFERDGPGLPCVAKVFDGATGGGTSMSEREQMANGGCLMACSAREDCNKTNKLCECRSPPYTLDGAGRCTSPCDKCIAIARSECNANGECVCRDDYELKDNACVPLARGNGMPVVPGPTTKDCPFASCENDRSSNLLFTIGVAVGASVLGLIVIGVIVCVVVVVRARRQREQLYSNPLHSQIGMSTVSSSAVTRRAPQSAYAPFDANDDAPASPRQPQSAYANFDPNDLPRGSSAAMLRGGQQGQSYSQSYSSGTNPYDDGGAEIPMRYSDGRSAH